MVAQNVQGCLVDAQHAAAVDGVGDDAALHGGEDGLQGAVLLDNFVLVGALLGDIDAHAHGAHDRAVNVVQRRFVGGEQARAVVRLDGFLGHDGGAAFHHLALRLDAGRVVGLDVPDIGVAAALDLLFGLVDCSAEGIVDLVMDAVVGFVPHQRRNGVDGGLQVLVGFPGIGEALAGLLPAAEVEEQLGRGQGGRPQVVQVLEEIGELGHLVVTGDEDQVGVRALGRHERLDKGAGIAAAAVGNDEMGRCRSAGVGHVGGNNLVSERLKGGGIFNGAARLVGQSDKEETNEAVIHGVFLRQRPDGTAMTGRHQHSR